MKYSLRSLMIVAMLAPPMLALAWFVPGAAAVSIVLFLPLLISAKFRLWGLFSSVPFGWGIVYLHGISPPLYNCLLECLGLVLFVALCLPFYAAVVLSKPWQSKHEPAP